MSNSPLTNGLSKSAPSTGKKKGPKPIQSLATLKETLLRDALAKEMKKIDRKIATETRKRTVAQKRVNDSNVALTRLAQIREEFMRDAGIKA